MTKCHFENMNKFLLKSSLSIFYIKKGYFRVLPKIKYSVGKKLLRKGSQTNDFVRESTFASTNIYYKAEEIFT